jgi:hypothetical protein
MRRRVGLRMVLVHRSPIARPRVRLESASDGCALLCRPIAARRKQRSMEILLVLVVLSGIVALLALSGHELAAIAVGVLAFVVLLNVTIGR